MDGNSNPVNTAYFDFSITTNRVQLQLSQLRDNNDLYFHVEFGFYSEELQSSAKSKLTFTWNTNSGRSNKLDLFDPVEEFDTCESTNLDLLSSIPSETTVDLNTDYLVETSGGQKGKFSTETSNACPDIWKSFTRNRADIKKFKMQLKDNQSGKKLSDYYTVSYRILTGKID